MTTPVTFLFPPFFLSVLGAFLSCRTRLVSTCRPLTGPDPCARHVPFNRVLPGAMAVARNRPVGTSTAT